MPILAPNTLDIISRSPEQTRRLGMRLGALLLPGDVVGLAGDLGSGKTTLVQGVCAGWGSSDEVSSPTFVLVNVYRRLDGQRLYHLDAYRLSGPAEAEDLDLDEMMDSGALIVEWSDRIQAALPREMLQVRLTYIGDYQRDLLVSGNGARYQKILSTLRREIYGG